jgi:glutathione S-transferase
VWTANTLHIAMDDIEHSPAHLLDNATTAAQQKAALLEVRLAGRDWIVGDTFSLVDAYVYMLVGWQHFTEGLGLGGDALQAHFARVGARPAVARARELDHLDGKLLPTRP